MFDRRLIEYFDWILLLLILLLATVGIITLYSAVNAGMETSQGGLYIRQLIWFAAGLVAMIFAFVFNYKLFDQYAYLIYGACIFLLICVLLIGKHVGGSQRWLSLGPVSLQPSELVKVAVIIVLAGYYSKNASKTGLTLRDLVQPMILVAIPFVLIVRQPDLGTAMLIVLIAASITFFVKIQGRTFLSLIVSVVVTIPLVWQGLKDYQKERIMTFLYPERDPLGAGYHIIQSKIAIGSGQLTGKGYLEGTQNSLSFLPEQHTDFIFSVLSEEWGLAGASVVLLLFLLLMIWGLAIAYRCRDPFGVILAMGIVTLIFWEVFINIGMVMGLMPVVGVPLPFVSYGGSSTITVMISMGLLMNISMRRFMKE